MIFNYLHDYMRTCLGWAFKIFLQGIYHFFLRKKVHNLQIRPCKYSFEKNDIEKSQNFASNLFMDTYMKRNKIGSSRNILIIYFLKD